jgi:hypothetical protein
MSCIFREDFSPDFQFLRIFSAQQWFVAPEKKSSRLYPGSILALSRTDLLSSPIQVRCIKDTWMRSERIFTNLTECIVGEPVISACPITALICKSGVNGRVIWGNRNSEVRTANSSGRIFNRNFSC